MGRVLVIEDDVFVRETVVKYLHDLGFDDIDEAGDGVSAQQALEQRGEFDFILADLVVPGADAVKILRAAAPRQPRAGVILMSAHGDSVLRSVAVLCRERGLRVLGALRKPLRVEALGALLAPAERSAAEAPAAAKRLTGDDLQRALQMHRISALAQPKVRAADGQLAAVEIFACWDDPVLGLIPTPQLVRLAEECRLGPALMQYMTGLGLRHCADWKADGRCIPVAINLGNRLLHDLQLPEYIERMMKGLDLPHEFLSVEISEHIFLDHTDALDILSRLRMLGVRVALDNFGTGQVSAMRLQRLPINELKFDPSIIRAVPDGAVAMATVRFGVELATALSIETTAVGVESEAQAQALSKLGCGCLQGYWLSRPMRAEQIPEWVAQREKSAPTAAAA